jgi:NAD-dependent dihydropyrimidine dehydrogenase PreA subunit
MPSPTPTIGNDHSSCDTTPGKVVPSVNHERCENKGPCVDVCPYQVLEIRSLTEPERRTRSLQNRLKIWIHGGKQAFVVRPEDCHACGLCVIACPEKAISLRGVRSNA